MVERVAVLTHEIDKESLLSALIPTPALAEVTALRSEGVDIEVGSTHDPAYDNAVAIRDMLVELHESGIRYATEVGRMRPALARLAAIARQTPLRPLRRWGKWYGTREQRRAEAIRSRLLYDRPSVEGAAWHQQNGRATALVTIVDALDLDVADSPGPYRRMSGRLDKDLLQFRFGANSGWLEGLALHDAVTESAQRFRHWDTVRAEAFAVTELDELNAFLTTVPTSGFKEVVGYCVDGLGIRSRKDQVRAEIHRHAEASGDQHLLMLSIGCGTALPMLEVLHSLRESGRDGHLVLVDQDPIALASAQQIAEQLGLADAVEIHCEQLILGRGRSTHVLDLNTVLAGRQVDVCEDSGLREYFPDFLYVELAEKTWAATKQGGLITTGNMNSHRPQPEFLHGLMGWPIPVRMRTAREVYERHAEAGVPAHLLRLRLTQEAVYTLCFVTKPECH